MANLATKKCKQSWEKYQVQDSILTLLHADDTGKTPYHFGFDRLSFLITAAGLSNASKMLTVLSIDFFLDTILKKTVTVVLIWQI